MELKQIEKLKKCTMNQAVEYTQKLMNEGAFKKKDARYPDGIRTFVYILRTQFEFSRSEIISMTQLHPGIVDRYMTGYTNVHNVKTLDRKKISDKKREAIRIVYSTGKFNKKEISELFNVPYSSILLICNDDRRKNNNDASLNRYWRHREKIRSQQREYNQRRLEVREKKRDAELIHGVEKTVQQLDGGLYDEE